MACFIVQYWTFLLHLEFSFLQNWIKQLNTKGKDKSPVLKHCSGCKKVTSKKGQGRVKHIYMLTIRNVSRLLGTVSLSSALVADLGCNLWPLSFIATLTSLLEQLMEMKSLDSGPDRLVREAAQGHTDIVKEIVSKHPDKVTILYMTSANDVICVWH